MHVVSREMNQILLSNLDIWFVSIGSPERESVSSCVQNVIQLVNSSRANQCLTWNSTGIWPILDENATGQLLIEFEERMRKHLDSKLCRSVTRLICELFMNRISNGSIERSLLGYDMGLSIDTFTRFFSTLDSINQNGKGVNPPFRWILEIKIDGEQRAYFL